MRYSRLYREHKKKAVNLRNGLTAFETLSQNVTKPALTPSNQISENRLSGYFLLEPMRGFEPRTY